jgi:hypothetical protein
MPEFVADHRNGGSRGTFLGRKPHQVPGLPQGFGGSLPIRGRRVILQVRSRRPGSDSLAGVGSDACEGVRSGFHFIEARGCIATGDHNKPVRIPARERFQKDSADYGEHGGVAAYSEGHDKDGGDRKRRVVAKCSRGVENLLQEGVCRGGS